MGTNWIKEWKEENRCAEAYIAELKKRHDKALESLTELAQGLGKKPPYTNATSSDWLKCKAATDLEYIAKMTLPKKPYLRTY